jgi:DNA-directed RNA polymerase subunit RPC12/RpoP
VTANGCHGPVDRITLHKERDRVGQRGLWVASCASCGYELRVSLRQSTAELARWRRCPVCGVRAARPRRPAQRTTR